MSPSWLCKWRSKVKYPFFCISGSTGPIELKFCMHMECDQTSILHNKVNLIWGHLGYANEGQRSNFPCFVSQEPQVRLNSNVVCIWSVTRKALLHQVKLIWGHLGYANEGQWRHNVLRSIEVKSHLPVIVFFPNFDML